MKRRERGLPAPTPVPTSLRLHLKLQGSVHQFIPAKQEDFLAGVAQKLALPREVVALARVQSGSILAEVVVTLPVTARLQIGSSDTAPQQGVVQGMEKAQLRIVSDEEHAASPEGTAWHHAET